MQESAPARMFRKSSRFQVAITPEGTRKHTEEWKRGFYYIALKAEVPILLAYIDYGKKEAGMMGVFHPTGDADKDIAEIRKYYTRITARHPENFAS